TGEYVTGGVRPRGGPSTLSGGRRPGRVRSFPGGDEPAAVTVRDPRASVAAVRPTGADAKQGRTHDDHNRTQRLVTHPCRADHRRRHGSRRTAGRCRRRRDRAGTAGRRRTPGDGARSEEHTSELQSRENLVCRLLLEKKKKNNAGHGTDDQSLNATLKSANSQLALSWDMELSTAIARAYPTDAVGVQLSLGGNLLHGC